MFLSSPYNIYSMSRKPALPNVLKISPLTYAELSKDQFSTNWFAIYDEMSPEKQAEYNRYLLAKLNRGIL